MKIFLVGAVLGLLMFIVLYSVLALALGIHYDFKTHEIYKEIHFNKHMYARIYADRIEIYKYVVPNLTEKQIIFAKYHWRDARVYTIVDKNGNMWSVGWGAYPRPTWTKIIIKLDNKLSVWDVLQYNTYTYELAARASNPPPRCAYYHISGNPPLIYISGQIGGTASSPVTWYVGYNNYYNEAVVVGEEIDYNISIEDVDVENDTDIIVMWTTSTLTYDCSVPPGTNVIELTINRNMTKFNSSLGPFTVIDNNLPDTPGNYTFVYFVKAKIRLDNGTLWPITRVYFENNIVVQSGDAPPSNPIARAIYNAFNKLKSIIAGAAKAIVRALSAILPDSIKNLLSDIWKVFNSFIDIFKSTIALVPHLADFFKLFAIMIPILLVAVAIYNPLLIPDFISEMIEYMRRIVSFIRSLLPV